MNEFLGNIAFIAGVIILMLDGRPRGVVKVVGYFMIVTLVVDTLAGLGPHVEEIRPFLPWLN